MAKTTQKPSTRRTPNVLKNRRVAPIITATGKKPRIGNGVSGSRDAQNSDTAPMGMSPSMAAGSVSRLPLPLNQKNV